MTLVHALEQIACAWNEAGLRYGVLHGLENYPRGVGRDLDILASPEHTEKVLHLARTLLESDGWQVARPPGTWGERIVAFKENEAIEIHTMTEISWQVVRFASSPNPATQAGPFWIDPWSSFAKRVLMPALSGDVERFRGRKRAELTFTTCEEEVVFERLCSLLGPNLSRRFVEVVAADDYGAFAELVPELRKGFIRNALLKTPVMAARSLSRKAVRKVQQMLYPSGLVVAIVGPDGVGKSSVLSAIEKSNRSVFTGFTFRHWRPGLLPPLGRLLGKPEPHAGPDGGVPPRREAGKLQWFRAGYYYLDFLAGYLLKDRPTLGYQRVIFYDRCFLDMAVDPLRFGLSSDKGLPTMWRLLPKPNLIILLSDQPERIYARKPELAKDEIARQLAQWQRWIDRGEVHATIPVDGPPAEIAQRVMELVRERFVQLNQGSYRLK